MTTPPPSETSQTSNPPLIRASELSRYGFCQRAWWLGTVKKLSPANQSTLEKGIQFHGRHARNVRAATHWYRVGRILLSIGSFLFVLAVVFSIFS